MLRISLSRSTNLNSVFDKYVLEVDHCYIPECYSRPSASHHRAINEFMSLVNPNLSAYEYIHRTLLYEFEPYEMPLIEEVNLDMTRSKVYPAGEYIVPDILGKGERSRVDTWKQVILSLSHRNFSAPRINEKINVDRSAKILFDSLYSAFDKLKISEYYDEILPDIHKISKWLDERDNNKIGKLKRSFSHDLMVSQFNTMRMMIKGDMKPKMDTSSYTTYTPPSNIIYYEHVINMFYSPLFLEVFARLVYCLSEKIVLYSGMNLDTLAQLISCKLSLPISEYCTTEIDFSKFDKSQGVTFKIYEEMVYKFFKFSEDIYENIKATEYFCKARSRSGVSLELGAQRRTGSPNTWLSNSLVTLGLILTYYDLDDIELLLVSGDDSLIFSKRELSNKVNEINKDFGMEGKFIQNSVPYFCSKFIVQDRGKIRVLPDPVRFFEKLSVPIRADQFMLGEILKERHISYKDLLQGYDYDTTCVEVDRLISIRYNIPEMASYSALCYIHCLCSNVIAYRKLFDSGFTVVI
ncbi:ORF1b [Mulberry crinivirus]|nr:ORF1b [Mulberry crinivirus]